MNKQEQFRVVHSKSEYAWDIICYDDTVISKVRYEVTGDFNLDKKNESEALDRAKMFSISYVLFNILEAEMDGKEISIGYKQRVLNYIKK